MLPVRRVERDLNVAKALFNQGADVIGGLGGTDPAQDRHQFNIVHQ
ncbi:Uncharacterised protein [Pluralibacter gergoviae]|nr:Uncharacterised protein [Pluralibacter gergoviae]